MQNLSQLKKSLQINTKVKITNHVVPGLSRDTHVTKVKTNGVYFDNNGKDSWFEYPKASEFEKVDDKTCNISFKDKKPFLTIQLL